VAYKEQNANGVYFWEGYFKPGTPPCQPHK